MLLAILAYVTLDLSLPAMPGAFVFDAADSVESIQSSRGRAAADVAAMPTLAADSFAMSRPRVGLRDRLTPARAGAPAVRRVAGRLPRATLEPAPPSEEPH